MSFIVLSIEDLEDLEFLILDNIADVIIEVEG